MVYIKMNPQMWILSGLEKVLPKHNITLIDNNRYIAYPIFKQASTQLDNPIHSLIHREHIITNLQMQRIVRQSELTAEQKQQKLQLKMKHELRMLQWGGKNNTNINSNAYYFEDKKDQTIKDMSKSVSFGMTFLFSFFMAGLTGYYVGVYFIGLAFAHALIVAALFIMATIIIQTALFIIKQDRDDKIKARKSKQKYREQFVRPSLNQYKKRAEKYKQQLDKSIVRPKTQ